MMELIVRHAWASESRMADVVRIHDSNRGGRRSGKVCKLRAVTNDGDGARCHYVEIRDLGYISDLQREYLENVPSSDVNDHLRRNHLTLEIAPEPPWQTISSDNAGIVFDYLKDSIFMNAKTREKFYVREDQYYQFEIDKSGLFGNCWYFIVHPDRYPRLLAIVALLLAILGYSLKDWIAAYWAH